MCYTLCVIANVSHIRYELHDAELDINGESNVVL
jgi:hypothetical protein